MSNKSAFRSWVLAGLCAAGMVLAPGSALAKNQALTMAKTAGLGFASAISSLVYGPVKIAYATTGLLVSGIAYAFSGGDKEVAKVVITPSVMGDYVITPQMLIGERSIQFFGREPGYETGPATPPPVASGAPDQAASAKDGGDDWSSGW